MAKNRAKNKEKKQGSPSWFLCDKQIWIESIFFESYPPACFNISRLGLIVAPSKKCQIGGGMKNGGGAFSSRWRLRLCIIVYLFTNASL